MLLLALCGRVLAQDKEIKVFSLKEAQDYAVTNSYSTRNAAIDLDLAKKKIWETTAIGLPQVNGSVQYQDYLDIPTTLLPDFITPAVVAVNQNLFGLSPTSPLPETQFFPAQFGTQHNLSVGGTVSQLIFNGQYLVGLQASRTFYQMSDRSQEKARIEIRQTVANTYLLLLVARENKKLLEEGVSLLERTVYETEEMYKGGFVEDLTVDQMKLNLTNLRNGISALDRQIELSDKLLKFQMGLDVNSTLELKDSIPLLISQFHLEPILTTGLRLNDHIDFRLMETQEKLQWLNMKKEQANYLPVITGFYSYQQRAMRSEFDFFQKDKDWFPTSIIGLQMDVPIFSSFMKSSKVQQARLSLDKARISKQQVSQGLQLDAEQARTVFNNSLEKFNSENENRKLAENIYRKTNIKFKEGISTSLEMTQSYNQYLTTQSNYFNALLEVMTAKIKYDKATSNL